MEIQNLRSGNLMASRKEAANHEAQIQEQAESAKNQARFTRFQTAADSAGNFNFCPLPTTATSVAQCFCATEIRGIALLLGWDRVRTFESGGTRTSDYVALLQIRRTNP